MIKKNITGIILAGGKSSRMGSDKGIVNLNEKKFIEHILAAVLPNVNEVLIIANNDNYNNLGYKVIKDKIKDCGPLGGIYTGLMNSKTENNIVVSCDIPFINSDLVKYIIENTSNADITVPVYKGNIEPLCAVYTKRTSDQIYNLIMNKDLKIQNILKYFITKELFITKMQKFYTDKLFVNINTPEELKQQKALAL
ncbi:MAG: molybdenum cofactor guanylyltransferase [Bacteroidota bacterium]|nr:molybdenum cofactor guanylyltransferase [Bacteroidota bacterium]